MSSNTIYLSETRRNRFSLRLFAALLALALCAFTLPHPAAAATCAEGLESWTTGSLLVHSITSSSTYANEIDEWDSDVVKIRHNMPGVLVLGAKGAEIEGTLYVWNETTEEADLVGTATLGGSSGNSYTTSVDVGDYCLEISNYGSSAGEYELNINFLDGCTLGILSPTFCENQ